MNYKGLKAIVLGLGESGRAAAELLLEAGADVMVCDEKINGRLEELSKKLRKRGAIVELGVKSLASYRFDLGVLSPGIEMGRPMVKTLQEEGTPVIGELELAYRFCRCPVIAITGTNGKSTTTELIAAILTAGGKKTMACGNLGTALSSIVSKSGEMDALTVEVSSFQLEGIERFRPQISVYLNFTPDHLDRYSSLDEYREAKDRIFENQTEKDYAILNSGCRYPKIRARKVTFNALGGDADYTFANGNLLRRGEMVLAQGETRLRGPHNAENQLAAIATGDLLGISREKIVEALCEYKPLPHRCEVARVLEGVTYINDSKATNIDAMEKALLSQSQPVVLIAGGKDKGFDFSPMKKLVREKARHAIFIGETKEKLFKTFELETTCHRAGDMGEAVKLGRKLARNGDVVLFSPGCSSYDMFKNFEERGDVFKDQVNKLN